MKKHLVTGNKYITYPKFIFLCGRAFDCENDYKLSNRGIIENFIINKNNKPYIVLSEKLWEDGFDSNIDLLTFEEFLAEISDYIIIFVESAGTFCELGAFSYADKLFCEKLLIVVDQKHKNEKSFILTGPVAKAVKAGAKVVYAKIYGAGLLSSQDLRENVSKQLELLSKKNIINKRKANMDENMVNVSSFIIEYLELLKMLQPVNKKELVDVYKAIKGFDKFTFKKNNGDSFHREIKIEYILKLLKTVGIVNEENEILTLAQYCDIQNLMLDYSNYSQERERNKLICRRYRYGRN